MLTRDEIITSAKQVGMCFITQRDGSILPEHSELVETFANSLELVQNKMTLTRNDVIQLAKDAGFCFITQQDGTILPKHSDLIEDFAFSILLLVDPTNFSTDTDLQSIH